MICHGNEEMGRIEMGIDEDRDEDEDQSEAKGIL